MNLFCPNDTTATPNQAFRQEQGQFVCSVRINLNDDQLLVVDDLREAAESLQATSAQDKKWTKTQNDAHITLLRGHRAIARHQIKPLIETVTNLCQRQARNFRIDFPNTFKVLENHEATRQFLCLYDEYQDGKFSEFKTELRHAIDKFATRLTDEDETPDTISHCSFMFRQSDRTINADEHFIRALRGKLVSYGFKDDDLLMSVDVRQIQVTAGDKKYNIPIGTN